MSLFYFYALIYALRQLYLLIPIFFSSDEKETALREQVASLNEEAAVNMQYGDIRNAFEMLIKVAKGNGWIFVDLIWCVIGLFTPYSALFVSLLILIFGIMRIRVMVSVSNGKYVFIGVKLAMVMVSFSIFYLYFFAR